MSSARDSFGFEYDTTALFINNGEAMFNYIHPNKRQVDRLLYLAAKLVLDINILSNTFPYCFLQLFSLAIEKEA